MSATARAIKLESEFSVEAPIDRVFHAYCHEQQQWYPHTYGGERCRAIVVEPRVGGLSYEDWGDGAGHLYGHVSHWDPPRALSLRSRLGDGITLDQSVTFEADGDRTVIKARTVTFGEISDEMEQGIRFHGDMERYADQFRTWVESNAAAAGTAAS